MDIGPMRTAHIETHVLAVGLDYFKDEYDKEWARRVRQSLHGRHDMVAAHTRDLALEALLAEEERIERRAYGDS